VNPQDSFPHEIMRIQVGDISTCSRRSRTGAAPARGDGYYVFRTPDKYAFDAVLVTAPLATKVLLDDQAIESSGCDVDHLDRFDVYDCQLDFPLLTSGSTGDTSYCPVVETMGAPHREQCRCGGLGRRMRSGRELRLRRRNSHRRDQRRSVAALRAWFMTLSCHRQI
jgi:hypothetical protein